mmetsp:Transcript_141740/g.452766  ORF Transcript_141740/g.452766 Transcript_141740/m.452766 type:complete len:440 (+) Transcript_141740:399-1718(+)
MLLLLLLLLLLRPLLLLLQRLLLRLQQLLRQRPCREGSTGQTRNLLMQCHLGLDNPAQDLAELQHLRTEARGKAALQDIRQTLNDVLRQCSCSQASSTSGDGTSRARPPNLSGKSGGPRRRQWAGPKNSHGCGRGTRGGGGRGQLGSERRQFDLGASGQLLQSRLASLSMPRDLSNLSLRGLRRGQRIVSQASARRLSFPDDGGCAIVGEVVEDLDPAIQMIVECPRPLIQPLPKFLHRQRYFVPQSRRLSLGNEPGLGDGRLQAPHARGQEQQLLLALLAPSTGAEAAAGYSSRVRPWGQRGGAGRRGGARRTGLLRRCSPRLHQRLARLARHRWRRCHHRRLAAAVASATAGAEAALELLHAEAHVPKPRADALRLQGCLVRTLDLGLEIGDVGIAIGQQPAAVGTFRISRGAPPRVPASSKTSGACFRRCLCSPCR